LGGITTSMLINYPINYYKYWEPDFIIVLSGINDVKTQLFSETSNQRIFNMLKIFNYDQKKFKTNFVYNPKYLEYKNINKVNPIKFLEDANKLKKYFKKSKIIWVGIHSNKNIDKERPGTFRSISIFNEKLRKVFKKNFIENIFNEISFRKDGYHLNNLGHNILYKKILELIKIKKK
jgi:lysophospholipase L1-like esterase